jgi:hypothetical protein
MSKAEPINAHEDADLFREAVRFTAAQTGFVPRLIEKDYFCTLLLDHLATAVGAELVFKGGTCLAKVHSELYRPACIAPVDPAELRPVLREAEFAEFDLDRAFKLVAEMAKAIA